MTIRSIINKLNINDYMKDVLIHNYKELNKARRKKNKEMDYSRKERRTLTLGMIKTLRITEQISFEEYRILYRIMIEVYTEGRVKEIMSQN